MDWVLFFWNKQCHMVCLLFSRGLQKGRTN